MKQRARRFYLLTALAILLMACQPAPPSPTAAPAKPTEAAKPAASPVASPAAAASPVASPAAAASPAPSPVASPSAGGLLPVAKPAGGPLQKVRVTQPVASLTFVTIYVGRTQKFFEEEGLDVEQIATGGGGPDVQALIAGEAQFNATPGTGHVDTFKQGRTLLSVFNALDKNIINIAMRTDVAQQKGVTPQSTLQQKFTALKGTNIGVTRPGALTYQQAEASLKRAGLTPQQDAQILGAGEGPSLIAALESGQVDVIFQSVPVPETVVARGTAIMLINNAAGEDPSIVPFNMASVLVTPDYAEKNADTVGKFVRACRKANQWLAAATPEQIADAVTPDLGSTPREVLVAGAAAVKPAVNTTGVLDRKAVQNLLEMTGSDVKLDELMATVTDRFLR